MCVFAVILNTVWSHISSFIKSTVVVNSNWQKNKTVLKVCLDCVPTYLLSFVGRHPKHEGDMQMPRSEWVLLINHMLAAIGTFPQNWRSFRGEIWPFDARQDHASGEAEGAEEGQERTHCQRLGVS